MKGQVVRVVPEADMVEALVATAKQIMEDGVDAVIASADAGAAAEAEAVRVELITSQGVDANHDAEKIERIRELAGD